MKIRRPVRIGAAVFSGAPQWVAMPEFGEGCELLLSPFTSDTVAEMQAEGVLDRSGQPTDLAREARSFFRRIVHDWREWRSSDGELIPYTTENRDRIAGIGHEVRRVVQQAAKELAVATVESEEGNSVRSSGGTTDRTGGTGQT